MGWLIACAASPLTVMTLLWKWIETFGLPSALYTDHKNVCVVDEKAALKASLEGEEILTQFGRACKKPGIVIITAHSPQAKGRVVRSNGVYQDRLVKEMRLADINDRDSANEFLYGGFVEELNSKFAVEAKKVQTSAKSSVEKELEARTKVETKGSACKSTDSQALVCVVRQGLLLMGK